VPKPLAFCITTLRPGGAERQLVELVLRLPAEEFSPHVVVLGQRPIASECLLVDRLTKRGIPLTFLGARGVLGAPATVIRLRRFFCRLRPALVQSFLAHANIASAIAARAAGVRPVVTGIRVAERRENLHAWLARRTELWVERHVCVSHSVAEFTIREMLLDPRKVTVIPNGTDVEAFSQAKPLFVQDLSLPCEARVLLHVGRLDVQKRIDWLLTRFAEALPRLPDAYLLLAGSGPAQVYLSKLASQLGIADRVRFLGWRGDVPRLLATCEALVLTSGWEGMPNVVLEAMAAARPVLVTEVEGVREVLGSLAAEQMVGREDADAFVERLATLWRDGDQRLRLGQANQARVRQKFSLDETAQQYVRLYRELLA
jgi:starch synthase (maltosyl-transferring)